MDISSLIEQLTEPDTDIANTLLKTKVLLHEIGRLDLMPWIDSELSGYSDASLVPDYRILPCILKGDVSERYYHHKRMVIPTIGIDDSVRANFRNFDTVLMEESVMAVLDYARRASENMILPQPNELAMLIQNSVLNGSEVHSVWLEVSGGSIRSIPSAVKSSLLDFLLRLRSSVSIEMTPQKIVEVAQEISIPAGIVVHGSIGDNALVILGANNTVTAANSVVKNDLNSLLRFLADHGVEEPDLTALRTALDEDRPDPADDKYVLGVKTSSWLVELIRKSTETGKELATGVSSSLIAAGIQAFF